MKKFIIGVFVLLSICACDPDKWLSGHQGQWYLKNSTEVPLEITCQRIREELDIIIPGDSILIFRSGRYLGDNEFPPFEDFLKLDSIYVYGTNGKKLCEWFQKNKEVEKRSVYEEKSWTHHKIHIAGPEYAFIWVFDIQNDDISNVNP